MFLRLIVTILALTGCGRVALHKPADPKPDQAAGQPGRRVYPPVPSYVRGERPEVYAKIEWLYAASTVLSGVK